MPTGSLRGQCAGQWLLERYGMTETNMMLSNPYRGERRPGSVGLPLPGVEVSAVSEDTKQPADLGTLHNLASQLEQLMTCRSMTYHGTSGRLSVCLAAAQSPIQSRDKRHLAVKFC